MTDMKSHESPYYVTDCTEEGRLHFTEEGMKELKPRFAKAGIDIERIRTKTDYLLAMEASSHIGLNNLNKIASNGPKTIERQALMSAISGSDEEFEEILAKVEKKNKLGLRVIQQSGGAD